MNETLSDQGAIYLQIAHMIEDDILRGIYREEEQVPSTNELARALRINPATAAKGINLLVDDGLLYKKRGLGMFVAPGAREKLVQRRSERFYRDFVLPLAQEAKRLGIEILPLHTTFGDTEYRDGYDLTHDEFFEKLIESDVLPTTSQIAPYEYEKAFAEVRAAGDTAVCITLSSKLSGCCQSARGSWLL